MPKQKTNKTAAKKLKVGGNGRIKRSKAYTSHNTAKKSPKRIRRLRKMETLNKANENNAKRQLPYRNKAR